MANKSDNPETYYIPPNFLTTGRIFGGMLRLRNAAEAALLVLLTAVPILRLHCGLTVRIVILCLISLPLGVFGAVGVDGDSLTEFAANWVKWLRSRRVLYRSDLGRDAAQSRGGAAPVPVERVLTALMQARNPALKRLAAQLGGRVRAPREGAGRGRKKDFFTEELVPVREIRNGIVHLADGRFVKILEIEPVNFLLRSAREQKNIIAAFAAWMKISPVKIQIKVLTKKADIGKHLRAIERDMSRETNPKCRELQIDYYDLIRGIGSREAITRRFFLIFEYEQTYNTRRTDYADVVSTLETAARTARQYFQHCGNAVVSREDEDAFLLEVLYAVYDREASGEKPLARRYAEVRAQTPEEEAVTPARVLAPESVDLQHGSYAVIDGVYHAWLLIPSDGYNPRVAAGWTSVLVNAGEGIDVDIFFRREPRERILRRLGQQIRINRSRIKDASDTNTDYDDIEGAIRSGYYLKQGLSENEDFYYCCILVTVTADTRENLEWRVSEVQRMLLAQDMSIRPCRFRQEAAMKSVMPFCRLDRTLFERGKRNMLTGAAASCYPYTSYEMSDENGILLGVNRHNNSLVIIDLFNSRTYKNANMVILGTSGAGKTFTLQLMALRMRRKGTQVFVIAPLKGHEFLRACRNVGGEFISISPASKHCINIMEIRRADPSANAIIDGAVSENSILARKIQQLHIFFSLLIPDMSHEEKQLLDETLIRAYAGKGITHDNASLADPEDPEKYREMPLLGDVYDLLMASEETRRMGNILNRLVHGSAKTFNQHTNVDLSNPYTVLDISELTGELLTVGMFVALDTVWDKAKEDRTKEKAIFIDEIWQLIGAGSNTMAAEFCLEIFKIIRGYGGAAIAASQDLSDFFALDGGKFGRGILNNAKTKIILNLEDDEALRVQDALRLTDAEVAGITRFSRGSGLISTNSNHITVEFKASKLEKQLITTDRYELSRMVSEYEQAQGGEER